MKILIIGGNGTIGRKVVNHYQKDHRVIIGGRSKGDIIVDIANIESIISAFSEIGKVDAIVCAAGEARWAEFNDLNEDDYYIGIKSKLMGQVNLVRIGRKYINPGGSITLSTGILADRPVAKTTSASLVNGAIHSFVKAVNLEIEDHVRVNVVSLGLVEDAYEKYKDFFPGYNPVPMSRAVNAYVRSIDGRIRGEIIRDY